MSNKTGIYIHIPFCRQKCRYCDFVSYPGLLPAEGERYVSALITEMQGYQGITADTVYIGGGTPTALEPRLLERVLSALGRFFSLTPDCEITVEANPGTCNSEGFRALAAAGVNRISLGVQSFVDEELALLGRIHTAREAAEAVEAARRAGIDNVSLDLMFSIPGQTRESLRYSLEQAVRLEPSHLSCYSLMLCEGTPLYEAAERGELLLPEDEEDRERYRFLTAFLRERGYQRYEISNFARKGCEARHNTKYWTRAPYIGLGAAAHSFFHDCRYENPAVLGAYYQQVHEGRQPAWEKLTTEEAMAEFMFLGLRLTEQGVLRREFESCFGKSLDAVYGAPVEKLKALSLLEDTGEALRLTERGIDVSNSVFCEFL